MGFCGTKASGVSCEHVGGGRLKSVKLAWFGGVFLWYKSKGVSCEHVGRLKSGVLS